MLQVNYNASMSWVAQWIEKAHTDICAIRETDNEAQMHSKMPANERSVVGRKQS